MNSERVWFTSFRSLMTVEPVFHRWHRALAICGDWTACGRSLMNPSTVVMPREHAERFARPCKVCYPAR